MCFEENDCPYCAGAHIISKGEKQPTQTNWYYYYTDYQYSIIELVHYKCDTIWSNGKQYESSWAELGNVVYRSPNFEDILSKKSTIRPLHRNFLKKILERQNGDTV